MLKLLFPVIAFTAAAIIAGVCLNINPATPIFHYKVEMEW
jgi:hypothetical protein